MIFMISIYDFEPLFSEFQTMIPKISNFAHQIFKLWLWRFPYACQNATNNWNFKVDFFPNQQTY